MTLREMKTELEKQFGGEIKIEKAVTTKSIYIELVDNNNEIVFHGRISDHEKSFQHPGDASVTNMNVEDFYNKSVAWLIENDINLEKKAKKSRAMTKFKNGERLSIEEMKKVYDELKIDCNFVSFLSSNGY